MSPAQLKSINDAEQLLTQRCMAARGYKYFVMSQPLSSFVTQGDPSDPLYINTQFLRSNGFGLYAQFGGSSASSAVATPSGAAMQESQAYLASLTPSQRQGYEAAVDGTGTSMQTLRLPDGRSISMNGGSGCMAATYATLFGSQRRYSEVFTEAQDDIGRVRSVAGASSAWASAKATWARCMKAAGFPYKTLGDATQAVLERYQAPGADAALVHQYEMQVASAAANCVDTAKLNSVSEQQVAKAASQMSSTTERELLAWDQMDAHAAQVAQQALGGSQG